MPTKIEKDAITGTDTTGHEWDGIKELNTPLPSWWLYVFYASIAFSLLWYVLYPSFPTPAGTMRGVLGYSQRGDLDRSMAELKAARGPMTNRIAAADLTEIRSDPDLLAFSLAGGKAAFGDNCAPCHGSGATGSKGYPNLVDDAWIWGGSLEAIHQTVAYGIRNANDQSRISQMPRFGADQILKPAEINDVAEFVLSFTSRSADALAAGRGAKIYEENCLACHGETGAGNQDVGAPRLNGRTWLYGGEKATIVETITYSRNGAMPAWSERLDPATIKMLAVYVHALGGGQ